MKIQLLKFLPPENLEGITPGSIPSTFLETYTVPKVNNNKLNIIEIFLKSFHIVCNPFYFTSKLYHFTHSFSIVDIIFLLFCKIIYYGYFSYHNYILKNLAFRRGRR